MHDMSPQALIGLDADNRLKALDARQSFIVEAPAGAGKTELLTQRYLKLLGTVESPEEIIALTFTNKAAAEMRNRILQSLEAAEQNTPVDAPHKQQTRALALSALQQSGQKNWQLLTQPSRLRILTIDALCSSLSAQMPLLSRLGGQPRVADDANTHYLEAAKRTLAMVAQETSLDAPISTVLAFMQNDTQKLAQLLSEMLAKREQWLPLTSQHQALDLDEISSQCAHIIQTVIEEKLALAYQVLTPHRQTILMPVVRFAASNLLDETHPLKALQDWQTPLALHAQALPHWLLLIDFLLTDKGTFRKPGGLNVNLGFPKEHADKKSHVEVFEQITEMIGDPDALHALRSLPMLNDADLHQNSVVVSAFSQVLQLAAAHLWQVFQSAGEVDFVAISRLAINALRDEDGATDLALKLDYKISHLLVDEFQDTNATQKELLELLTAGWQPNDGRTLFCVGDPMQSIYRFRKADVSLFLQAATHGIGQISLQPLKLTRNNRSHPQVVDWINQKFKSIFPPADNTLEAAISYREFIATRDAIDHEGVQVHALAVEGDEESAAVYTHEAHYVAALIDQAQREHPSQTIAVLVRSRTHLHALVSEIRRHFNHLKFQAVEIEGLSQRQTVQDALSLTRAMLHRADRVHWLNILRAPWCGLTLNDLHALCAHDHRATIWQLMQRAISSESALSIDGQARLTHVHAILNQAFNAQGRVPLRRWIESTWLQLGGGSTLISAGDNRDIQAFFDLIETLTQGHSLDFTQLETAMEKLYAEPDITENDHLQFLTIHKSKGLEFDCVILPALNRKPRHADSPLMLWEEVQSEAHTQLLAAPYSKKKKNSAPTIYDYIKQLEATRANNETARLLYVAATRAIRQLHLVATVKRKDGDITPVKQSLLELLWPSVGAAFMQAEPIRLQEDASSLAEFTPQLMRLPTVQMPAILAQHNTAKPMTSAYQQVSPEPDSASTSSTLATDKGTLAHLYMQLISNIGLDQWSIQRLNDCKPAMVHWLLQQRHSQPLSTSAADEIITMLHTTLTSHDGQWVLKARPDADNELAIEALNNQVIQKKVIDRTFIEHDTRWIIDYKSIPLTPGLSDATLQQMAEPYREQLEGYAVLFKQQGLTVQKAVFFLSVGKLVTLI
ncbi:UvrD-helicase domain-containing protein [Methylotenera sp. N17]|uniref:UvrD-helicase domain-containing protein n=1 Tax=Methylotenera sp. N17 TaxID=1502761 RepID=UPI000645A31A|nr:UvrD-helicase domain-containing protein [Methylotenera sp. N17]